QGPYGDRLNKAIDFIVSQEGNNPPGFIGEKAGGTMYVHGYAVLFLAEAHKVLPRKKKEQVKALLQRAVQVTVDAQNGAGGWRYQPRPLDGDLTITACQLHALRAARDAGVDVPNETLDKAVRFIKSCHNALDGGFRYTPPGGASSFARTAMALSALNRAG